MDDKDGLTAQDAYERLARFGPNSLAETPKKTLLRTILDQFEDRLVLVLLGVALTSALLAALERNAHAFVEPTIICAILLINAVIGAVQSLSALDALGALKKLQPSVATVLRQGQGQGQSGWREVPAAQVVPGDVVSLRPGDKVPADGRLLACRSGIVSLDESCLTGESGSVTKDSAPVPREAAASLADRTNMVFSGTMVTQGSCTFLVTHTGEHTEIGKINAGISSAKEATASKTPLMQSLDRFSAKLYKIIAAICFSVWVVNIPKFSGAIFSTRTQGALHYAKVAVALGEEALPAPPPPGFPCSSEGLPLMFTFVVA